MANEWGFRVPDVQPYVRTTQRQKYVDPRYRKYSAWKRTARLIANTAGVPEALERTGSYGVSVVVLWKARARCDLDNVIKAVLDALFADDRRVLRVYAEAEEDHGEDGVVVTVRDLVGG